MSCCCAFTLLAKAVLVCQLIFKVFPWLYQNVAPKFRDPKSKSRNSENGQ
uniref:Uncharacterized protein n=1 Tax=Megaselia scalaris TaxID=36166 RepID=T1H076_MEGSC